MHRLFLLLAALALPTISHAWNSAGHRLVARIAWQQLDATSRVNAAYWLREHPDRGLWIKRGKREDDESLFVEAATWADDIRGDPRYYDELQESPLPAIPGLADNARHKHWHYVEINTQEQVSAGEIDRQIVRLHHILHDPRQTPAARSYALPWLIHLVADLHQPLHVGCREDEGGNGFEIEDPEHPRQPFQRLHAWWDDLPGPPWLRGQRLVHEAELLLELHAATPLPQGNVTDWRTESLTICRQQAYPEAVGSLLPQIEPAFRQQAQRITRQRLVFAGRRLAQLLRGLSVPRGTGWASGR